MVKVVGERVAVQDGDVEVVQDLGIRGRGVAPEVERDAIGASGGGRMDEEELLEGREGEDPVGGAVEVALGESGNEGAGHVQVDGLEVEDFAPVVGQRVGGVGSGGRSRSSIGDDVGKGEAGTLGRPGGKPFLEMVAALPRSLGGKSLDVGVDVIDVHGDEGGVQVGQGEDGEVGAEKLGKIREGTDGIANKIRLTKDNTPESPGDPVGALLGGGGGGEPGVAEGALGGKVDEVLALGEGFVGIVIERAAAVVEDVGAVLVVAWEVG